MLFFYLLYIFFFGPQHTFAQFTYVVDQAIYPYTTLFILIFICHRYAPSNGGRRSIRPWGEIRLIKRQSPVIRQDDRLTDLSIYLQSLFIGSKYLYRKKTGLKMRFKSVKTVLQNVQEGWTLKLDKPSWIYSIMKVAILPYNIA